MKQHAPPAPMRMWLVDPLSDDVAQMLWRLRRTKDVARVAVMPDVHLSHDVCVGTVFATHRLIYPAAVGGDIGCGMAAIAFDGSAAPLRDRSTARAVLDQLSRAVPIIRQHRPPVQDWTERIALSDPSLTRLLHREARLELGTLGRGNHFVELQADESDDTLWLLVHTGSRGLGQQVRDHHLQHADGSSFGLRYVVDDSPAGRAYRHDHARARGYAAMNRRLILNAVSRVIHECTGRRAIRSSLVNRDHNHIVRESHFGRTMWVHRKGANRARRGEVCLVPGSMGTFSVHALGRGEPTSLCSSSHGAGRVMDRSTARRRIDAELLLRQMDGVAFPEQLLDRLREESPSVYRDLSTVLRAQRELIRPIRRLQPVLVYKG